ncbi:MAG: OmpA family protein [Candidatus Binatia bacterium]
MSRLRQVARSACALGALALAGCYPKSYVVLLPEADGPPGAVEVTGKKGKTLLAEPWKGARLSGGRDPFDVPQDDVEETFGTAMAAAPTEPARFILYFKSDTSDLTTESRRRLPDILAVLRERPTPEVDVVGHTDTVGPNRYNDRLAIKRAERIRDELLKMGVARNLIEVTSYGELDPLVKTGEGVREQRNRRVEVLVR